MNKIRNRVGIIMIIIGSLMILSCAVLFLWNRVTEDRARKAMNEKLESVTDEIEKRKGNNNPDLTEKNMPVVFLDGYEYIGYISIPSVELDIPVMNSYDDEKLKLAACRYYGSLESGDLVICGHNYKDGTGKIHSAKVDDIVYFTNMDGEVFEYTIKELEVLEPEQVHEMVETRYELSIYTCTYGGGERFTIRCELKN